jgi:murein DD-endopeptidase MepM/ murein hydrolase activator NlpD
MRRLLTLTASILFIASTLAAAPSARAAWVWPVAGDVITPYRNGTDPYATGQHRGIDIAAPVGALVRAAAAGDVRFAGTAGTSGLTISIRTSDGYDTSYLHLSSLAVRAGAHVSAGERIGVVGTTGTRSATAPHLHFGIRDAGTRHAYHDPLAFLPPPPVGAPAPNPPAPAPAPTLEPAPPAAAPAPVPRRAPAPSGAPRRSPAPTRAPRRYPAPRGAPRPLPAPRGAPRPSPAPTRARRPLPAPSEAPGSLRAPRGAPRPLAAPSEAPGSLRAPRGAPGPLAAPGEAPGSLPAPRGAPRPLLVPDAAAGPASEATRSHHPSAQRLGDRVGGGNTAGPDIGWAVACAGLLLAAAILGVTGDGPRRTARARSRLLGAFPVLGRR